MCRRCSWCTVWFALGRLVIPIEISHRGYDPSTLLEEVSSNKEECSNEEEKDTEEEKEEEEVAADDWGQHQIISLHFLTNPPKS